MHLTQLSQLVLHWEIVDANENVLVRVLVVGVHLSDKLHSNHVEHRDDECGLLGEPELELEVSLHWHTISSSS